MALGECNWMGTDFATAAAYPIFSRNFTKTLSPPKGVTGRSVSRKTTFFFPKIELISRGTVLFLLSFRQTMQIYLIRTKQCLSKSESGFRVFVRNISGRCRGGRHR